MSSPISRGRALKSIAAISPNPKAKDVNLDQVVDNSILEGIAAGK